MNIKIATISTFVLMAILHFIAVTFYFYWTIWWFDIMMHVVGGFLAGLVFVGVLYRADFSRSVLIGSIFAGSVIIGTLWEIFEYKTGMTFVGSENYVVDTVSDLMSDVAGGLIAYLMIYFETIRLNKK